MVVARRRLSTAAAAALTLAGAGCGVGNQVGAMQIPAAVSGVVYAGPPCPPPRAASACGDHPVAGAVVQASGKDGVHTVSADARGAYTIRLLLGHWNLSATAPTSGARSGPTVAVDVAQGQSRTVNLDVPGP